MFRYLPEQASEIAPHVDFANNLITDLSVFFTVAICGAMLYMAIKYRKRGGRDHETPMIRGNHFLEIVWTGLPTIVCIFVAWYGIEVYAALRATPDSALEINVTGQKWVWNFEYENGKRVGGQGAEFVVPVNKPVKIVMTGSDVLHSFFIPAMRVKQDVVPGKYSYVAFRPTKVGLYDVFCTEFCGTEHSRMLAKIRVASEAEYERWLNDDSAKIKGEMNKRPPAEVGRELYNSIGCMACHSLDGSKKIGPSFLKIFGREGTLDGGKPYKVDENYIRESLLNPKAKIVDGYSNQMPPFEGRLDDAQIGALIAFMKSVDGSKPAEAAPPASEEASKIDLTKLSPAERGERIYKEKICITCHSLDGTRVVGPTFKGIYGRSGKMADGSSVTVDDAYIKESILSPNAKIVEGYSPMMPPYQGQLSDEQVQDVIEFLKTVK